MNAFGPKVDFLLHIHAKQVMSELLVDPNHPFPRQA